MAVISFVRAFARGHRPRLRLAATDDAKLRVRCRPLAPGSEDWNRGLSALKPPRLCLARICRHADGSLGLSDLPCEELLLSQDQVNRALDSGLRITLKSLELDIDAADMRSALPPRLGGDVIVFRQRNR
ncbi:MAG TPA: hypothetical protein VM639_07135 [Dongiaceae bacterium]|nr:hypothetical protein [Dongiaceae bacterium]